MLTPRETEILILSADGLSAIEAAERLGLAPKTVQTHRHTILRKLAARNMVHALAIAYTTGILAPASTENVVGRDGDYTTSAAGSTL